MNHNTQLKAGQIAHLDHDRKNNTEGNLAFLCFDHHDEYDSKSSQRKQLTITEVKQYRSELLDALGQAFSQPVHFGEVIMPPADPYAGKYVLLTGIPESAEVIVTPVPDDRQGRARYLVSGFATKGHDNPFGPNIGEIDFVGVMDTPGEMCWVRLTTSGSYATSIVSISPDETLVISEDGVFGEYGFGVGFEGIYMRAARDA